MDFELGVKSDPIEYRYSFEWLFALMRDCKVLNLQLGSFFELYSLEDSYFLDLRSAAASYGIVIRSVFTSHRELGGFFAGDRRLERVARRNYERLIEVAALVGASYVGSNPGSVFRDRMAAKEEGIQCYLRHMKELMAYAKTLDLEGLSIEPMSCSAEPPSFPTEIKRMVQELSAHHEHESETTVPVYLCSDISHGFADQGGKIIYSNVDLFEANIRHSCEFHIKNTDTVYGSTFGFTSEDIGRGIVDLDVLMEIVHRHWTEWPVPLLVGYLEIGGPKLGRDYSDLQLEGQLVESIASIRSAMKNVFME
jgi:ribulose-phosphate 3-epimerase